MTQIMNFLFGLDEIDEILDQIRAATDEYEAEEILAEKIEDDPSLFLVLSEYVGANPTEDISNLAAHVRGDVAWCSEKGYHFENHGAQKRTLFQPSVS